MWAIFNHLFFKYNFKSRNTFFECILWLKYFQNSVKKKKKEIFQQIIWETIENN